MSLNSLDKSADNLIKDYQKAYIYILSKLKYQINNGLSESQTRSTLLEIQQVLKELDNKAYKWSYEVLPQYYNLSLKDIDIDAAQLSNINVLGGSKTVLHTNAIKVASASFYKDLAKRTTYMSNEAKRIIRKNGKDLLTLSTVSGQSHRRTKRQMRDELIVNGVTSFIDAGGKHWTIDNYVSMAIRTKSRLIHNEGLENRLSEYRKQYPLNPNFDLIQISSHGSTCWCGKYEGTVWSISGTHPDYPSIKQLPNYPYKSFHPNCKHVWKGYMIELRGNGKKVDNSLLDRTIKDLNKEHYHAQKA